MYNSVISKFNFRKIKFLRLFRQESWQLTNTTNNRGGNSRYNIRRILVINHVM